MLHACRRLDDFPMTVRVLEAVYDKGAGSNEIYNYILGEIKPTMEELGLSTPEELGLAKWCQLQDPVFEVVLDAHTDFDEKFLNWIISYCVIKFWHDIKLGYVILKFLHHLVTQYFFS